MITEENKPLQNPELAALASEASAVDIASAPAGEVEAGIIAPAPALSELAEIESLLTVAVGLFSPALPSIKKIYTSDVISQIASVTVPVMKKHGWTLGEVFSKWAEEIAFASVVIPLGMATYQGVKSDITAAKKAESAKPVEPQAA